MQYGYRRNEPSMADRPLGLGTWRGIYNRRKMEHKNIRGTPAPDAPSGLIQGGRRRFASHSRAVKMSDSTRTRTPSSARKKET